MNEPTHIHILQAQSHNANYILAVCATLEEAQALKDYGEETDMPHYGYCYGYERVYIRSLPIGYRDNLLPKELPCQE
jgi:hypothetical protein